MTRLRTTALIALIGMAWAVLLPFTSAAHLLLADEPVPYCHQLSVTPDSDEGAPTAPKKPPKGQCPFCASAAAAAPSAPLPLPCFVARDLGHVAAAPSATPSLSFQRVLPPSRAPPAFLRRT